MGSMIMRWGMLGAEGLEQTCESQNTQSMDLRFHALLDDGTTEVQLALSYSGLQ